MSSTFSLDKVHNSLSIDIKRIIDGAHLLIS